MDFKENINCIKETEPGKFRILLDFATPAIVKHLIKDNYRFVWVHNHYVSWEMWTKLNLPINETNKNQEILAKGVNYDFIVPTEEFKKMNQNWLGIELIQMNKLPPAYLDLNRIKGDTRYELLKNECDYLFELHIPYPIDYGELISPNREYLQSLIDNPEINWSDLP